MHTQTCSCVCMILPRNPNPNFSDLVSNFTCNTSILDPFYIFVAFEFLFHMFICWFAFHMFKLGFIFIFLFQCHEHGFTCSCMNVIGVELL